MKPATPNPTQPSAAAVANGCFGALAALLEPQHGAVRESAALALRPLAPGLLGTHAAGGGGGGKAGARSAGSGGCRSGSAIRACILAFAREALRCVSNTAPDLTVEQGGQGEYPDPIAALCAVCARGRAACLGCFSVS